MNFQIETVQTGRSHLSYLNEKNEKDGYCNMWETEGYIKKRENSEKKEFLFQSGDFLVYDLGSSVREDYMTGGTH